MMKLGCSLCILQQTGDSHAFVWLVEWGMGWVVHAKEAWELWRCWEGCGIGSGSRSCGGGCTGPSINALAASWVGECILDSCSWCIGKCLNVSWNGGSISGCGTLGDYMYSKQIPYSHALPPTQSPFPQVNSPQDQNRGVFQSQVMYQTFITLLKCTWVWNTSH